ncbi:hypothetical protein MJ3_07358 [Salimicrobium jeotgali]|uniref:DUF1694 domain-containing protein n=2 Tax=Salimicrobium jeotgali TaxID=1230341 RepID=K2GMF0_9BACI|nr:YueI family protein [Salimicrobium jeotgali]EKE31579.1 hypothetical protein MJ3_07358 [Salimicrobium jeotgali]MBM7696400.1 uncharacterized protein YueI [Salimicrobium jeotgali]
MKIEVKTMRKREVEDYVQEGIYGTPETKPGERRRYLGTLRERIVLVLTKSQVMQKKGMAELEKEMRSYDRATLLLNGKISYRFRKPYSRLARKYGVHTKSVSDQQKETEIGAVLTVDYPLEKEEIKVDTGTSAKKEKTKQKKGMRELLKKLFKPIK